MNNNTTAVQQQATLPPLQPSYVLRGHDSQVHSVQFLRNNSRILTGDADGWVVLWRVASKRAVAVWRAHTAAILGTNVWGRDRVITHGRDNSLRVWKLGLDDEPLFSTTLPKDDKTTDRQKPWLLHSLTVNTLNFCSFSLSSEPQIADQSLGSPQHHADTVNQPVLVAVPGASDKDINIFRLPSEQPACIIRAIPKVETGMTMALRLLTYPSSLSTTHDRLLLIAGYESGMTILHSLTKTSSTYTSTPIYISHPHKQPILSLTYSPQHHTFYTSAADPHLTSHPLPLHPSFPTTSLTSTAAPPQSLASTTPNPSISSLAASLSSSSSSHPSSSPSSSLPPTSPPLKSLNTSHSGHQSLTLRSDARILATAGWDARVRVFSAKSLKEVAVLKWHREGCYAVGFAEVFAAVGDGEDGRGESQAGKERGEGEGEGKDEEEGTGMVLRRQMWWEDLDEGLGCVQREREVKARRTHWVVVGSKDGNVSLWEVY